MLSGFLADLAAHGFLQRALLAGVLASVACGAVGALVVARRSTYLAGAIAHSVLGGMGAARWLDRVHGQTWATPLLGALGAALLAAVAVAVVTRYARERRDTLLSAIWAVGMAVGISFIHATPGYQEDLMSYLFGNILMVGSADLWLMGALDLVILATVLLFHDRLLAVGFHDELARLRGIRSGAWELVQLVLVALTVVLLTRVVGLVLVIALLALPAATALSLVARLSLAMLLGGGVCLLGIVGGLALSHAADLPTGATIIEVVAVIYLVVVGGGGLVRRLRRR